MPVLVGVCDGFVGNRILWARQDQANKLVKNGILPWEIDKALNDFGFKMGHTLEVYLGATLSENCTLLWNHLGRSLWEPKVTVPSDDHFGIILGDHFGGSL